MRKYLYHVIKSRLKNGTTKYAVRRCTVESYKLRLKTHDDDGMYFDTFEKACEIRDKLIEKETLYGENLYENVTGERKIGWVSIRLMGTESDCLKIIEELENNFVVTRVSPPYENRQGNDVRFYCKLCRN